MPQNPISANVAAKGGVGTAMLLGVTGSLLATSGGALSTLNLIAAGVIKASPGRVSKVVIIAGGTTGGAFVLNDTTTTGGAAAANEILYIPEGAAVGSVYSLDWPCLNGIVLSAVPTGGSPIVAVSFT
jgi:hypothetical protein